MWQKNIPLVFLIHAWNITNTSDTHGCDRTKCNIKQGKSGQKNESLKLSQGCSTVFRFPKILRCVIP